MGADAVVECGVWLKLAAEVGPSVPIPCCVEFAMHQTVIFLVVYGELHHEDLLGHLSKNVGLQFGHVECILGAQCLCDQKKVISITFVLHQPCTPSRCVTVDVCFSIVIIVI
jgi:hypothetical protein